MPHLPKNVTTKEKLTVLSYHPEEIARQLTLIDFQLFASIKPFECLNQNWMKAAHDDLSPNVMKMIRRFNEVSGWIASEILKFKDLPTRTKALKQIIEIAEVCLYLLILFYCYYHYFYYFVYYNYFHYHLLTFDY